jgi:hypothetical protein
MIWKESLPEPGPHKYESDGDVQKIKHVGLSFICRNFYNNDLHLYRYNAALNHCHVAVWGVPTLDQELANHRLGTIRC